MPIRHLIPLFLLIFLFTPAPSLYADGDSRPATEAEKSFITMVKSAIDQAVPSPFAEWEEAFRDNTEAPDALGTGKLPRIPVEFALEWVFPARQQAFDEQLQILSEKLVEDPAFKKNQADMEARVEAISAEMATAVESGNAAEMSRLEGEMSKVAQSTEAGGAAIEGRIKALEQEMNLFDSSLRASFRINSEFEDVSRYRRETPLEGGLVFVEPPTPTSSPTTTLFFFGDWQETQEEGINALRSHFPPNRPSTSVGNLRILITAHPPRAVEFLKALNWPKLKALFTAR